MAGIFDLGSSSSGDLRGVYDKVKGVSQDTPNVPQTNKAPSNLETPAADIRAGVANPRTPWFMTCKSWLGLGGQGTQAQISGRSISKKFLVWACNPSEVSWTLNQRGVLSKNKTGTVLHVWRDKIRNTFYDEPILNLSLQSGSVMPLYVDSTGKTFSTAKLPYGLDNFYQFLQLFDETKITADGTGNFVTIQYGSAIFPKMTMIGMFVPDSLRFSDSSNAPNQVSSWTVSFQVYSTIPAFNDYGQLVQSWNQAGFGGAIGGYGSAPPDPSQMLADASKALKA